MTVTRTSFSGPQASLDQPRFRQCPSRATRIDRSCLLRCSLGSPDRRGLVTCEAAPKRQARGPAPAPCPGPQRARRRRLETDTLARGLPPRPPVGALWALRSASAHTQQAPIPGSQKSPTSCLGLCGNRSEAPSSCLTEVQSFYKHTACLQPRATRTGQVRVGEQPPAPHEVSGQHLCKGSLSP